MTNEELLKAIEWLQSRMESTPATSALHWHYAQQIRHLLNEQLRRAREAA